MSKLQDEDRDYKNKYNQMVQTTVTSSLQFISLVGIGPNIMFFSKAQKYQNKESKGIST
jgi:hypothetical protein